MNKERLEKQKHIKIKRGEIVFASEETKSFLAAFYFGYHANPIMKLVDKDFLQKLIDVTTKNLNSIGLTWKDIPSDNKKWGVVLEYINYIKENNHELATSRVGAVEGVEQEGNTK